MPSSPVPPARRHGNERRLGQERRRRVLQGLITGSLKPRRRGHRRHDEVHRLVDWHDARWLAVVILVLLLSTADAMLTMTLVAQGNIREANPLMAPLVHGDSLHFALWKLGLTSGGIVTLTVLARQRAFGWLSVGLLLYLVLAAYTVLIGYELKLLDP